MTGWLIAFAWSTGIVSFVGIPSFIATLFIERDEIAE